MESTEALRRIEAAIAEIEKIPNFNVEYTVGAAIGMVSAYQSADVITWEDYRAAQSRIEVVHKRLVKIVTRTGRANCILAEDVAEIVLQQA